MSDYLETIYFEDEYGENKYPQKLCNYITNHYFTHSGKLLDVGSGKGNHLLAFHRNGHDVCGLDKRKECIEALGSRIIKRGGLVVQECDIECEPFPYSDSTFDWVFSKSVIEHVWNTDNFLRECHRVLKPNGRAVIMTPDWGSQHEYFWDDYTHVRPFTRKSLQNAMKMCGFNNVEVSLFLQLPFIWEYPKLKFVTRIVSLLPDSFKWKNFEQSDARKLIRFSREKMLFAVGGK